MVVNANFDALLSTTLQNYRDTLEDNLSNNVVLWYFLKENGRITKRGGTKIIEPILYGTNTTSASYSGYDAIAITAQDGISAAEFDWSQHAVTVAISGIEEAKNAGEYAVIDLLKSKIEQAEISAIDDFDVMFHGDGTGNSNKDFNGLGNLIGATGTVGGINSATAGNEFWRSYEDTTAEALTIADMTTAFHKAVRGTEQPKFGTTTLTLFEAYNADLQANQRFTDAKTAQAGFQNLTFQGQPLTWGENVPSGTLTFVNPKFLRLNVLGDTWLKSTPFTSPETVDARYAKILSYGELTVSNRKLAGSRLSAKTA